MRRWTLATRVTAVTVGVALLLAAAWWVLRAPAIEHRARVAPPEIDIDPPAMRARREAALALATMPDDPWTFAESLAASAPVDPVEKEDCGISDRPKYNKPAGPEDPLVETAGASPRYVNAQARLDAALRASADPLDRAVADLVNVGDMRTIAGRDEAVVQQATTTTDPRLYALAFGLCQRGGERAPSCGSISLERWIQLDAGNGIPWVWMLVQAQDSGDAAAARTAMAQLASASRFDFRYGSVAGAVASRVPKDDADLAAVSEVAVNAISVTASLPFPQFQRLLETCRVQGGGDPAIAHQCQTISDVMFDHSDSLIVQSISGSLLWQTTGDDSRRKVIRAERALAAARWSPATGFSECRDMRTSLQRLRREAEVGEVEAMRERARQFVAP